MTVVYHERRKNMARRKSVKELTWAEYLEAVVVALAFLILRPTLGRVAAPFGPPTEFDE